MNIDIQDKADSHNLNGSCVNSALTMLPVETVNEVRIDSLNYRDEMRIRTDRSEYRQVSHAPLLVLAPARVAGANLIQEDVAEREQGSGHLRPR